MNERSRHMNKSKNFITNRSLWIWAIIISFIFILASCMGAESKMKIQNDGSGTILFSYRISRMLLEMGNTTDPAGEELSDEPAAESGDTLSEGTGEEENSDVPLPITKEDFEKSVEGIDGLELISVTENKTDNDVIITAELSFESVEALSQAEAFSEWPITFEKDGEKHVFTQLISEGTGDDPQAAMDEETINMVESMFEGYEFSFSVEAPSPVQEHSIGELSADKKTVTYAIPVAEMMRIKEPLELIIIW
jgi:hypothetical protein